jgi:hypothetical protein
MQKIQGKDKTLVSSDDSVFPYLPPEAGNRLGPFQMFQEDGSDAKKGLLLRNVLGRQYHFSNTSQSSKRWMSTARPAERAQCRREKG